MLYVPRAGFDFSKTTSYATGLRPQNTATFGTTVTPTTNAYSTPSQIGADLTTDAYGMYINFNTAFTAATPRGAAVRFSVDYAGGTTWTTLFEGLLASEANAYGTGGGGLWYYFPIFIPAGSAVAISAWGTVATAIGANVIFMTQPTDPSMTKRASFVETLGLTTGASTITGVTVTPSVAATEPDTWTLIGTTTKRCWWWQFAVQQLGDTTMGANGYHLDLATGTATTKDIIILDSYREVTASETYNNIPDILGVEKVVPAGSNIYARIHNAGTNDGGTYQIVAYGCGG